MEAAGASAAPIAGEPLRGPGLGAPSDSGSAPVLSPSLSHWLGDPASWLRRSRSEQDEGLGRGRPPHSGSLGGGPFLGSPTPGGAPGWRRGDVPTHKFSVRPFAVAQQANLVDPKCCPFCCERRVAARFLREEVAKLQAELEDLTEATHPALREKLTKFRQQHGEESASPSSPLPFLWVPGSPQGVLTAAASAASAALSAAAAIAAEAVSEAFEGASCRGPRAVSFDFDELLLPDGFGNLEAAEPLPARRGPPRGPRRAASSPHPSSVGGPLLTWSVPSTVRGPMGPTGAPGVLMEGAEAMVSLGRSLGASFTHSLSGYGSLAAGGGPSLLLGGRALLEEAGGRAQGAPKDTFCRLCSETEAEVARWKEKVAAAEQKCLLTISFNAQQAEEIEALLVSSHEAACNSSSSSTGAAAEKPNAGGCDSEAPQEDEPQALALRGVPSLSVTGLHRHEQPQQQQQQQQPQQQQYQL
ncbi:hypothetical protein Esti_004374 [Eimeria stiedai]